VRPTICTLAVAAVGLTLLGGCSTSKKARTAAATAGSTIGTTSAAADLQNQYENVVKTVLPSVVQITTDSGEGSGVVYDGQGDIVTNAHVVAGAKSLSVTPASGGKELTATLVGSFTTDDLAVIKVSGSALPPATFGDSTKVQVGQIVMAMGNPLGLSGSVSQGIVSALGRTITTQREGAFPGATTTDSIQTTAAINPGNSGGALVDLSGQVVGIPSSAASDPQIGGAAVGIGFAIPSSIVNNIAPQLIKTGKVTNSGRAALGVTVRTTRDLQTGEPAGVDVVSLTKGGAAEKAGLVAGDVITAVNGTATPSQSALAEVLAGLKPGQAAKVTFRQPSNGASKTVDVTLGELSG
jgi:putative serine protease PepD